MQMTWCWRCRMEVPMFDDEEFSTLSKLHSECVRATKEFRQQTGLPLQGACLEDRFRPMLDKHFEMTGFRETNPNAIMHHKRSQYGPACRQCGRPLRTPITKKCYECGEVVVARNASGET